MAMEYRELLKNLEKAGGLKRVKREVDTVFEMTGIMKKLEMENGPAVLFEKIKGHEGISVAGNLFSTKERIAFSMGAGDDLPAVRNSLSDLLIPKFEKVREVSGLCQVVKTGPVRDVVLKVDKADVSKLPVLTHCEKDGGPYIGAGVVVARDPETNMRSIQVIEIQVKGPRKLNISPVSPPIVFSYAKAEKMGKPLEVAIVIGVDPEIMLAACAPSDMAEMDKYEIAAAFKGETLNLVRCETVSLEVPANAEIVIEGKILPEIREDMGPVGDYLKTYYWREKKPVIEISAITHRESPIYQGLLFDGKETAFLIAIPGEIALLKNLGRVFPSVRGVYITPNSGGAHHAIVSMQKRMDEEARSLILYLLSTFALKHVVVVDADIDIFNLEEVEWAIAIRVQADKDVIIIPGMHAIPLDPSAESSITAKMGIDATRSLKVPAERYLKSDVPRDIKEKIVREWEKYFE